MEAANMELSREDEELVGDFRAWLDSCSPDDFHPPDCGVGARNIDPEPQLPPLEAEVGLVALSEGCRVSDYYDPEMRGLELCAA